MANASLRSTVKPGKEAAPCTVGDIMTPFPETVRADASVQEAAGRMRAFGVGFLPVVSDQELVGVVTDRDLVTRVLLLPGGLLKIPVSMIMTRDVIYCDRRTPLATLVRTLSVLKIRRMPVLEMGEGLLGVIGLADLVRAGHDGAAASILDGICRAIPVVPRGVPDL